MSSVISFFNRQQGLGNWRRYDGVLERFSCQKNAHFNDIYPNEHNFGTNPSPIFCCKFSQTVAGYEHLLALANENGSVSIVDLSISDYASTRILVHNNAIFDLAWLSLSSKLITASGDHSAVLLDLGSGEPKIESSFLGHHRSLKTVATSEDNPNLFATAGRDGMINLWDIRGGNKRNHSNLEPEITIPYAHLEPNPFRSHKFKIIITAANSVTSVVFRDQNTFLSCGAGDGAVKAWDMRKNYSIATRMPTPKYVLPHAGKTKNVGFSHMVIDQHRNILYVSGLDNVIYAYNISTYNKTPINSYYGHKTDTFYVKMCLGMEGNYLSSGSSDGNAYIWHRNTSTPLVRLVGHQAEVTGVAWHPKDAGVLVTCSDDHTEKVWTLSKKQLEPAEKKSRSLVGYTERYQVGNETVGSKCECSESRNFTCGRCGKEVASLAQPPLNHMDLNPAFASTIKTEPRRQKRYLENSPTAVNPAKRPHTDIIGAFLTDLPNYLTDGKAPHLTVSPDKPPERDWLTKLRQQMALTKQKLPVNVDKPPESPKTTKPSQSTCDSPLLRYFKVTNSHHKTAREKSPNVAVAPSSPTATD